MAYGNSRRSSSRGVKSRRYSGNNQPRRRARVSNRGRKSSGGRKTSAQTIRIVIENPQPQIGYGGGSLPSGVGNTTAVTPRKSRF